MLQYSDMSKGFWAEAMGAAVHILNRAPRKSLGWRTPYKILFGQTPDVSYIRIFGCRAWAYNDQGKKWDPKALLMILVSYETGLKAYCLWNPVTQSIVVSMHVQFDESILPNKPTTITLVPTHPVTSSSKLPPPTTQDYVHVPWFNKEPYYPSPAPALPPPPPQQLPTPAPSIVLPMPSTSTGPSALDPDITQPIVTQPSPSISPEPEPEDPLPTRKSTRKKKVQKFKSSMLTITEGTSSEGDTEVKLDEAYPASIKLFIQSTAASDPTTYEEAIGSNDIEHWKQAMQEEFNLLEKMETWVTAPLPECQDRVTS